MLLIDIFICIKILNRQYFDNLSTAIGITFMGTSISYLPI